MAEGEDVHPPSGAIASRPDRGTQTPPFHNAFYAAHRDAYDFLIVFPTFDYDISAAQGQTLGWHSMVRNSVTGIGMPYPSQGVPYGSASRLKGYIDINSLVPSISDHSFDSALGAIAHEVAHQWSGRASFFDPATGSTSLALLGRDQAHWSFFLDSNASVLYGSRWQPSGTGSFTAVESLKRYSPLDLYLMGLFAPSEVPAFSLIRPAPGTAHTAADLPPSDGTVIQGTAQTITIDQIIQALGARNPAAATAQAVFRAGFALLLGPGQEATPAQIAFVDSLRREWANRFFFMTQGRAVMETELVERPAAPSTQYPSLGRALEFLLRAQRPEGAWMDESSTTVRETQVALEALREAGSLARITSAQSLAGRFLNTLEPVDADTQARRALALAAISQFQALAIPWRNQDGGIGLVSGYQSSVVDTVLAVLASQGSGQSADPEGAITFLLSSQNGDGGWPFVKGGRSFVEPTAWH